MGLIWDLDEYCLSETYWTKKSSDLNGTITETIQAIPQCFQHILLVFIPLGFMLLTLPLTLCTLNKYKHKNYTTPKKSPTSVLFALKMFSYVAIILVWISSFIYEYLRDVTPARPEYPALLATPIFYILSTVLAFSIEHYTTQVSDQKRSGVLWTYWLTSVLGSIILTVLSFTTEDQSGT